MVLDDEKAKKSACLLKSPSWPDMCISIELSFVKYQMPACASFVAILSMKFTSNEKFLNIQRNAACASTLNMYFAY